jgi:hypothetical protein
MVYPLFDDAVHNSHHNNSNAHVPKKMIEATAKLQPSNISRRSWYAWQGENLRAQMKRVR